MSPTAARWASVAGGVAAACALAFAIQLPWWSFAEAEVFLTRSQRCFGGECQEVKNLVWLGAPLWWHRLSTATFGIGLGAGLLALFVAGARAAGRTPRTAAGSLLVAVVTALGCGIGTLATFPKLGEFNLGAGPMLFAAGLVAAGLAAVLGRRALPDLAAGPAGSKSDAAGSAAPAEPAEPESDKPGSASAS